MGARVHLFVWSDNRLAWTFTPRPRRWRRNARCEFATSSPGLDERLAPRRHIWPVFFKTSCLIWSRRGACLRSFGRTAYRIARRDAPRSSFSRWTRWYFAILRVSIVAKRSLTWRNGMILVLIVETNAFISRGMLQISSKRANSWHEIVAREISIKIVWEKVTCRMSETLINCISSGTPTMWIKLSAKDLWRRWENFQEKERKSTDSFLVPRDKTANRNKKENGKMNVERDCIPHGLCTFALGIECLYTRVTVDATYTWEKSQATWYFLICCILLVCSHNDNSRVSCMHLRIFLLEKEINLRKRLHTYIRM
jgi:hypothetical protein